MPSWSSSEAGKEGAATPPADPPALELEAARKLLEQLFADAPDDEASDPPEQ